MNKIISFDDLNAVARKRDDLIYQAHLLDIEIQRYKIKMKAEKEGRAEKVLNILQKHKLTIDDLEPIINKVLKEKVKD
jgi:hypothetical protein